MADQSQINALLQQGITAARAGQAEQARQILLRVVELDEANVQGWLWLSSVVDDPADKFTCLHNVLTLEPENQPAQLGLARLDRPPPSSDTHTADTNSPLSITPAESMMDSGSRAEVPPSKPTGRTSRYKRLSPRLPSEKDSVSSPTKNLKSDSSTEIYFSRSQKTINPNLKNNLKASLPNLVGDFDEIPKPPGSAQCPFCRSSISVMAVACDHCQLPLVVDCPVCDAGIDVEATSCPSCGQSMGTFRGKTGYFSGLATAYQSRGKNHHAVMAWEVVESLDRDYPGLYLSLAKAQVDAGQPRKAIHTLRSILEIEPGQEAASLALGEIYHNLNYWDQAEEIYREALAVSPDSAELNFAFGWLLVDYGQVEQGLPYVRRATELDPEHGMAWFRLGQIHDAMHKSKQATEAYGRAVIHLSKETLAYQKAVHRLSVLEPELPQALSTGWAEFVRQIAGPFMVCLVAVLLDSGLRPWWIPLPGWGALLVGFIGTILWVSGISLPQNPAICWLVGKRGLTDSGSRIFAILIGGFLWLLAMGIILYPINQSVPEVPEWILNS